MHDSHVRIVTHQFLARCSKQQTDVLGERDDCVHFCSVCSSILEKLLLTVEYGELWLPVSMSVQWLPGLWFTSSNQCCADLTMLVNTLTRSVPLRPTNLSHTYLVKNLLLQGACWESCEPLPHIQDYKPNTFICLIFPLLVYLVKKLLQGACWESYEPLPYRHYFLQLVYLLVKRLLLQGVCWESWGEKTDNSTWCLKRLLWR